MHKAIIVVALALASVVVHAQEWVEYGGAEYNCVVLRGIIADYGDSDLSRSSGDVMTVGELFAIFFPSCPPVVDAASVVSNEQEITFDAEAGTAESIYSFDSDTQGLEPVIGPFELQEGHYILRITTDGDMTLSSTTLSDDCGFDANAMLEFLNEGEASTGAHSVLSIDSDCRMLLEVNSATDRWMIDFLPITQLTVLPTRDAYAFDSADLGLEPVIGPMILHAGVYLFTIETDSDMTLSSTTLSDGCGFDIQSLLIFVSMGEATSGDQTVVEVDSDCELLLEMHNADNEWTLDIEPIS